MLRMLALRRRRNDTRVRLRAAVGRTGALVDARETILPAGAPLRPPLPPEDCLSAAEPHGHVSAPSTPRTRICARCTTYGLHHAPAVAHRCRMLPSGTATACTSSPRETARPGAPQTFASENGSPNQFGNPDMCGGWELLRGDNRSPPQAHRAATSRSARRSRRTLAATRKVRPGRRRPNGLGISSSNSSVYDGCVWAWGASDGFRHCRVAGTRAHA